MRAALAIAKREIDAYFATPIGWVCLTAFALLSGFFFVLDLVYYMQITADSVMNPSMAEQVNVNDAIVAPWFGQLGITAILITPALSMRLIAEDRRNKSIELLLTSPLSSYAIAFGKMLGAAGFAALIIAVTAPGVGLLYTFGDPDSGMVFTNYLGLYLLTLALMTMGLFYSSMTENQIVALVLAFGTGLSLWIVGWGGEFGDEGALKTVLGYLSLPSHLEDMGNGVLHAKNLAYLITFTGFFALATAQRVEALRWR
jgi:ABC-2 type transport system permease protein